MSSLDDPSVVPIAGQEVEVGFTILQHGETPVNPEEGLVGIRLEPESGPAIIVKAAPVGAVGHYVATVTAPSPGTYTWSVLQGWFEPHDLGTVEVVALAAGAATAAGTSGAAEAATARTASSDGTDPWRVAVVGLAAVLGVGALVQLVRTGRRPLPVAAGAP
jgi:hypothetical protein